jgi:hypothetical protein
MSMACDLEMLETIAVCDTFVTGLGRLERASGGNWRMFFYTDSGDERVLACKLVVPDEAMTAIRAKMLALLGPPDAEAAAPILAAERPARVRTLLRVAADNRAMMTFMIWAAAGLIVSDFIVDVISVLR